MKRQSVSDSLLETILAGVRGGGFSVRESLVCPPSTHDPPPALPNPHPRFQSTAHPAVAPPPPTPTPPPLSKPCSAQLTRLRLATRFRPLESDAKCAVMRAKEASKYRTERPTMPDDKCGGRWVGGWVCCGGWRGPPCLMIRVLLWR